MPSRTHPKRMRGLAVCHWPAIAALLASLPVSVAVGDSSEGRRMPPAEELPSVKELPDPFVFLDGSRVKSKEDWKRRREELRDLVLYYEYGRMPPPPGNVKAEEEPSYVAPQASGSNRDPQRPPDPTDPPSGATEKRLRLTMGPGGKVSTHVILTIPKGKGPFPAIVRGDLCWGRVKPEIREEVAKRGYLLAEFDRTEIAPDNNARDIGAYPHYPDHDWRGLAAWAWGFHRVIDYLLTRDDVDARHIAVTGHSRGGKASLLAGATDERITLTNPNNSGCGGAGCYRFQPSDAEDIARITKAFPFWFSPRFPEFIGKVDRLPFDQHSVKALVAPRALLTTEALGDRWANPEGTQHTYMAAREVYEFLGAPDKIAVYYREGKHEHNLDDWKVLLDYADKVFFGKQVERNFNHLAFPESPKQFSWSAPTGK
jgi:hypothetical protein